MRGDAATGSAFWRATLGRTHTFCRVCASVNLSAAWLRHGSANHLNQPIVLLQGAARCSPQPREIHAAPHPLRVSHQHDNNAISLGFFKEPHEDGTNESQRGPACILMYSNLTTVVANGQMPRNAIKTHFNYFARHTLPQEAAEQPQEAAGERTQEGLKSPTANDLKRPNGTRPQEVG